MSVKWWEANKRHYILQDLKQQVESGPTMYSAGFCGSCGTTTINRKSGLTPWRQYYLYGAWGLTPEKAKEILQVEKDPSIVTYSVTHDGETHTFLWKDE